MVKNEPPVDEQVKKFIDFVGDLPVVGHNIKASDLRYIGKATKRAGVMFSPSYFDTYLYAKNFKEENGWTNLKLEYLSDFFCISQPDAHRAWCDAEANTKLYYKLKNL
jgi:DNA polymerase III epsilon subunit-like protein